MNILSTKSSPSTGILVFVQPEPDINLGLQILQRHPGRNLWGSECNFYFDTEQPFLCSVNFLCLANLNFLSILFSFHLSFLLIFYWRFWIFYPSETKWSPMSCSRQCFSSANWEEHQKNHSWETPKDPKKVQIFSVRIWSMIIFSHNDHYCPYMAYLLFLNQVIVQ